jgi:hypothetical protein
VRTRAPLRYPKAAKAPEAMRKKRLWRMKRKAKRRLDPFDATKGMKKKKIFQRQYKVFSPSLLGRSGGDTPQSSPVRARYSIQKTTVTS